MREKNYFTTKYVEMEPFSFPLMSVGLLFPLLVRLGLPLHLRHSGRWNTLPARPSREQTTAGASYITAGHTNVSPGQPPPAVR